ncbi:MAG: murein biosynthesis integral membrane protein MurJ [Bacillota bacterium]
MSTNTIAKQQVVKATGIIMAATILARLLGFLRETVVAAYFGASASTDAFLVANIIPTIAGAMVASGIGAVFIPVFIAYLNKDDEEEGWQVAKSLAVILLLVLTIVSAIGILGAPYLIRLLAPGFNAGGRALAVSLTRILTWGILFSGIAALFTAILNSFRRFAVAALGPVVATAIVVIVTLATGRRVGIYALALGYFLGTVGTVLMQLPALYRYRHKLVRGISLGHPALKEIALLAMPVLASSAIGQVNLIIDRVFASMLSPGSIAALNFGDRLVELPLGIVAAAVATAVFPNFARMVAQGDRSNLKSAVTSSLRMITMVMIPAEVGLIVLSTPIVHLLFERGEFGPAATRATAIALTFYALGIVPFAWQMIIAKVYFAMRRMKLLAMVSAAMALLNVLGDWLLMSAMGIGGLALATSLVWFTYMAIMFYLLHRQLGGFGLKDLMRSCAGFLAAALVMGGAALGVYRILGNIGLQSEMGHVIQLGGAVAIGTVVYLMIMILAKVPELKIIYGMLPLKKIRTGS